MHALASAVDLEVVQTRYRGDATAHAAMARHDGYGLIVTLGGDGTVNEVVNGVLADPGPDWDRPGPAALPAIAPLPGGSANVFTRTLGLSPDPVDAAGQILAALAGGRHRDIGVGRAEHRFFTFNAGLGLDAEVVRAVEGRRAHGRNVSPALYARMAVRQFYRLTDRRHPALTLERDGRPLAGPFYLAIVSNTAPWTYLGNRPVNANPRATFDRALDLFALSRLGTPSTLRAVTQLLSRSGPPGHARGQLSLHDQPELEFSATRPVAFQVDGEYMGEYERVAFCAVPKALRVIA